jgi:hypothetical protein
MSPGSDARSVLLDAALWNLPNLRRNTTADVAHFIDAFSRRLDPDSISEPHEPLDLAAVGVAADVQGESERASGIYAALAEQPSEVGMLGMFLSVWSGTSQDSTVLAAPIRAIEAIGDNPLLQARLGCKLIAAAYAHQWDDVLPELFARAQGWAPPGSMIAAMLKGEAYNLLGDRWPSDWAYEPDELTSYDWIRELAWSATAKSLTEQVIQRVRSPWSITIGVGFSETEDVIAALMQAEWAGAIWLRREISQQLAAHILLDDSTQPEQTAIAVSLWTLNSTPTRNLEGVAELAEPRFDMRSADQIIGQLDRGEALRVWTDRPLTEMSVALWDLISEQTMLELLDRFPLYESDHPDAMKVAVLWSLASLRVPEVWNQRFGKLDNSQHRQFLGGLAPAVAERLPKSAALQLIEANPKRPEGMHEARILAVLADRAGHLDAVDLSRAPAAAIALISGDAPPLVRGPLLDRATQLLIDECRSMIDAARQGRRGLGTYEPLALLALACTARQYGLFPGALDIFEEAAMDARVPADVRYEAVRGLTVIAHHVGLPSGFATRLVDLPETGAAAIFEFVTPRLMHAARIALLIACRREGLDSELLMLVHDELPRVRQIAVEATSLALNQRSSEALEGALASALFDPDEVTVRQTIAALRANPLRTSTVRLAIGYRLFILFDKGSRKVRAAVVGAVTAGVMPSEQQDQAERLLERAKKDRSFQVRDVASRER